MHIFCSVNDEYKQKAIKHSVESIFHHRLFNKAIEHYACNIVKKYIIIHLLSTKNKVNKEISSQKSLKRM